MKAEARLKAKATRLQKSKQFQEQTIKIGDWKIERFDQMNWVLKHKGIFRGYYGSLINAFKALPVKMLDEEAKNSLAGLHSTILAIQLRINDALKHLETKN